MSALELTAEYKTRPLTENHAALLYCCRVVFGSPAGWISQAGQVSQVS